MPPCLAINNVLDILERDSISTTKRGKGYGSLSVNGANLTNHIGSQFCAPVLFSAQDRLWVGCCAGPLTPCNPIRLRARPVTLTASHLLRRQACVMKVAPSQALWMQTIGVIVSAQTTVAPLVHLVESVGSVPDCLPKMPHSWVLDSTHDVDAGLVISDTRLDITRMPDDIVRSQRLSGRQFPRHTVRPNIFTIDPEKGVPLPTVIATANPAICGLVYARPQAFRRGRDILISHQANSLVSSPGAGQHAGAYSVHHNRDAT